MSKWGSPVELERKRRINVALWAYSYEVESDSIVDDATYDRVCREIDLSVDTGNEMMDEWFRHEFSPDTGQWVLSHPELHKISAMYKRLNREVAR